MFKLNTSLISSLLNRCTCRALLGEDFMSAVFQSGISKLAVSLSAGTSANIKFLTLFSVEYEFRKEYKKLYSFLPALYTHQSPAWHVILGSVCRSVSRTMLSVCHSTAIHTFLTTAEYFTCFPSHGWTRGTCTFESPIDHFVHPMGNKQK